MAVSTNDPQLAMIPCILLATQQPHRVPSKEYIKGVCCEGESHIPTPSITPAPSAITPETPGSHPPSPSAAHASSSDTVHVHLSISRYHAVLRLCHDSAFFALRLYYYEPLHLAGYLRYNAGAPTPTLWLMLLCLGPLPHVPFPRVEHHPGHRTEGQVGAATQPTLCSPTHGAASAQWAPLSDLHKGSAWHSSSPASRSWLHHIIIIRVLVHPTPSSDA